MNVSWFGAGAIAVLLALGGILAPLVVILLAALLVAWPREPLRRERLALAVAFGTHHALLFVSLLLAFNVGRDLVTNVPLLATFWLLCVVGALPVLWRVDALRDPRALPRVLLRAAPAGAAIGWATVVATLAVGLLSRGGSSLEIALAPAAALGLALWSAPYALSLGALVGFAFGALDVLLLALARRLRAHPEPATAAA